MPIMKPPVPFAATAFMRFHHLSGGPQCTVTMGMDFTSAGMSTPTMLLIAQNLSAAIISDIASFSANVYWDVVEVLAEDGSAQHATYPIATQGTNPGTPVHDTTECKVVVNYPPGPHKLVAKMFVPGQVTSDYATANNFWVASTGTRAIAFYEDCIAAINLISPVTASIVSHAWAQSYPLTVGGTYTKDLKLNHQTRRTS